MKWPTKSEWESLVEPAIKHNWGNDEGMSFSALDCQTRQLLRQAIENEDTIIEIERLGEMNGCG